MSVSINIKAGGALYEDILKKIDKPLSAGTQGQVLTSDGQGGQVWTDLPEATVNYTDLTNKPQINGVTLSGNKTASDLGLLGGQDVSEAVEDWLDDHPEATTTVQDGAISYAKLDSSLKGSVDDVSDLKSEINSMAVEETLTGDYHVLSPNDNYLSVKANQSVIVGNKNMVPVTSNDVVGTEYTSGGITRVRNADDSYTYSGIATRNNTFTYKNNIDFLPPGKYTLSGAAGGLRLNADYFLNGTRKNLTRETGSGGSGTLHEGGTNLTIYFEIPNGTDLSTPITVKPQLERGEVATEYVKCANHEVQANTNIPINETTYIFASASFSLTALKIDMPQIRERISDSEDDISDIEESIEAIESDINGIETEISGIKTDVLKSFPQNNLQAAQMLTFTDGADQIAVESLIVNLDYSSTARSKLRAFVASENLFNLDDVSTKAHIVKNTDGSIVPDSVGSTTSIYTGLRGETTAVPSADFDVLPFLPAGTYYITGTTTGNLSVKTVNPSDGSVANVTVSGTTHAFTLASDSLINIMVSQSTTNIVLATAPQDSYKADTGKTYVVPFVDTDETAFTMYGGTVDLVNGIATELYDSAGEELETPVVHEITPIAVKSCLGFNHVWSDCDGVLVTYRADIKEYVDQRNMSKLLEKYNIDASLFGNVRNDLFMQPGTNVIAIAHRGLSHDAPENTMPAYKAAAEAGFLVVETDIDWTSDGVPVLLHDGTINRTARNADGTELTQTISIRDITYEQALTYDFGIWKGEQFAGTKIPTFDEFILFCRNAGLHPMIELKYNQQTMEQTMLIVQKVIEHGMINRVGWISNFKDLLLHVLSVHQGANITLIASSLTDGRWSDLMELKGKYPSVNITVACGYDYIYNIMDETIARLKAVNVPMNIWTIDNSATIKNFDPYITSITSNALNAATVLREAALE